MYKSVTSSVVVFFFTFRYIVIIDGLSYRRRPSADLCFLTIPLMGTHAACVQKPRKTVVVVAVLFSSIYIKCPPFRVLSLSFRNGFPPSSFHTHTHTHTHILRSGSGFFYYYCYSYAHYERL